MPTFIYEFEELPLRIVDEIEAGYINGCIEVEYCPDGESALLPNSICLEGYRKLSFADRKAGKKPWVYVPAPLDVAAIIQKRLENEWADRVSSAVADEIEAGREAAAETRAEQRRDERMGA